MCAPAALLLQGTLTLWNRQASAPIDVTLDATGVDIACTSSFPVLPMTTSLWQAVMNSALRKVQARAGRWGRRLPLGQRCSLCRERRGLHANAAPRPAQALEPALIYVDGLVGPGDQALSVFRPQGPVVGLTPRLKTGYLYRTGTLAFRAWVAAVTLQSDTAVALADAQRAYDNAVRSADYALTNQEAVVDDRQHVSRAPGGGRGGCRLGCGLAARAWTLRLTCPLPPAPPRASTTTSSWPTRLKRRRSTPRRPWTRSPGTPRTFSSWTTSKPRPAMPGWPR